MSSSNDDVLHQAAAQSSGSNKSSRGPRPRLFLKDRCQADDCGTSDLKKLKFYNRRNHICLFHQKSDEFSRRGQTVRFCQRCAIAHPLEEFDGTKRSCREKLEKFNSRRRKSTATAKNTTTISLVDQSPSTSSIPSEAFTGLSSEIHDLDSIDLGFSIEELLPVQEGFNMDLLLPEAAAPAPAPAAVEAAAATAAAPVPVATSTNGNERVCCTTMDAECICCQSSEQQQQHDGADDVGTSSSSSSGAADNDGDNDDAANATSTPAAPTANTTPADCDDTNACLPGSSDIDLIVDQTAAAAAAAAVAVAVAVAVEEESAVEAPRTPTAHITAVAAAAKLEAEFAALQATDAAMYAMIVHQQMMQARLLLTTTANALLLQRARSGSLSSGFSRKESFGEISPMVM